MFESYLAMSYEERYQVRKTCYFALKKMRRWSASEIYGGNPRTPLHSYPGAEWRKELISILKPFLKHFPEFFFFDYMGCTAEQVIEKMGLEDLDTATKRVIDVLRVPANMWFVDLDWAMNMKIMRECDQPGAENVAKVQGWLDDYGFDLLDAADVDVHGVNIKAVGKSLAALGHKKVRTGGKSPGQYLWILDHYEKYANLKPAQLLKVWKEQTSQI